MKILVAGSFIPLDICPIDCTQKAIDAFKPYCHNVYASLNEDDIKDCDGVVFPGGVPDLSAKYWGEENTGGGIIDETLDELQMKMLDAAVKQKKPILGFCRGHQLINVYFGGTLNQDIKCRDIHLSNESGVGLYHQVQSIKGTFMHDLYGDQVVVNSYHHQAIERLANDLEITQVWSNSQNSLNEDFIIEGYCHRELPIIGVQWHPEFDNDYDGKVANSSKLFEYFLELIKQSKRS